MDIQNISGADYISRGFDPDPTPREETHTREAAEPAEARRAAEPEKGQTIDTYA